MRWQSYDILIICLPLRKQKVEPMKEKVLVTGANGQLGCSLRKMAGENPDYDFIYTDKDSLDITDENALSEFFFSNKPHTVLHFAAYTAVDRAESDKEACRALNLEATRLIATLSEKHSCRLLFVSTDFVFDGVKSSPYLPNDAANPLSEYGRTKAEAEKAVRELCSRSLIVRTSWLYSEFGANFVKTMRRLGSEKSEIGVVFDQVGTPCYASDLAKAILACLKRDWDGRTLHFSNEGVCSWYDFARKIMELSHLDCKVRPIRSVDYPTPATRPSFSVLDKSETKAFLSIDIPHWEDSLLECIKILSK